MKFYFWFFVILLLFVYLLVQFIWPVVPFFVWQIFCLLVPCVIFLRGRLVWDWQNYAQRFIMILFISVFVTMAVNWISEIWEIYFPLPDSMKMVLEGLFHPHLVFGSFYDVFQIALIPALAEECLFRGVIFAVFLANFQNRWAAIFLSAAIFALFHLNPWHLPFLFILGCFFALIYERTHNLTLTMLAHFVNNAIGVFLFYQEKHL